MDLGKVATLQRGYDLPSRLRRSGDVPVVTSTGVTDTHSEAKEQAPGVVTGRYGTIGQVFYIEEDYWPHNTTLFIKDFHGNDPLFVSYLLRTIDFNSHSGKSGVPGVNRNDLHELSVRIPSTIDEQRSLATVLSDTDALLGALDLLITKKRDLKQAAMQQLLTGKTRLPGLAREGKGYKQTEFGEIPEDWDIKPLFSIAEIRSGIAKNSNISVSEPVLVHYLRVANVQDGFLDLTEMNKIEVSRNDLKRYSVLSGDVLMNEGGDLDKLGRGCIWRGELNPCVHQNHVFIVRSRSAISPEYLNVWTSGASARRYFLVAGKQTTNLATINKTALGHLPVALPPLPEQTEIATILSDMDSEIAALKQAMMQELLTGRIRLV
jgi:type I restriction enzyme, S subunit